jgi:hypothetical protein
MSFQDKEFHIEDTEGHGVKVENRGSSEAPYLDFSLRVVTPV